MKQHLCSLIFSLSEFSMFLIEITKKFAKNLAKKVDL